MSSVKVEHIENFKFTGFYKDIFSNFKISLTCATWTLTKRLEKKLDGNFTRMFASNIEQVLATTPHKTTTIRPLASHHENYTS